MRIEWSINKKRGNLRPDLTYSVSLEEHEKALALPPLSMLSSIPKPEEERQEYCYPGQFERAAAKNMAPGGCHGLEIPSHKGHSWARSLRLPWRADNEYPEIEASFQLLREVFEKELAAAYASAPMTCARTMEISATAKAAIAPGTLAERFLRIAEKSVPRSG